MNNHPTYEELTDRIKQLETDLAECEMLEKKVSALSQLCGMFGTDHLANINIVVQQTLEILSGTSAVYHRFDPDNGQVRTIMESLPPHQFNAETLIDMIGDSIATLDKKEPVGIFEDLSALLDEKGRRLALSSGLASCMASLVIANKEITGVLCVFDVTAQQYSVTDQRAINTLAIAIAIEEERGAAEKTIRDSEERYRTIIEDIEEGFYEIDVKGNFTFINDAFCTIFGYSREELIGKNYIDFTTPETARQAYDVFNAVFSSEKSAKGVIWEVSGKGGTLKFLESSISLIKNQDGVVGGFRGIVRDMTERRQLEFQLRQAQKMEAIGTLAGGIAHEFNNILGIIIGNTELALFSEGQWEPIKQNLDEIWRATLRARDVIEQMQTFSRKKEVTQRIVSIGSIVKESLKLLRVSIPSSIGFHLNIDCPQDTVLANTTQIHQVLINLCTNASHAMQDKGGLLSVSLTSKMLSASQHPTLVPGLYVVLQISDTGVGISADDVSRIFDPYYSTKAPGKGSGMGLAIVHGIVRSHGGDITVSSQKGKGSVFTVMLPLSKGQPSTDVEKEDSHLEGNERILIVDDEEPIVYLAKKNLERMGYQVSVATKPEDALVAFENTPNQFDLVITDMIMPGMTGDKLTAALHKVRPDIPVVICTGCRNEITEVKVKEMGGKALVMKPFTTRKLAKAIRNVIEAE